MSKPVRITAVHVDGDAWAWRGRWGPATVAFARTDGTKGFCGLTPLAWHLLRLAAWWSRCWLRIYVELDRIEWRCQCVASQHQQRMRAWRAVHDGLAREPRRETLVELLAKLEAR